MGIGERDGKTPGSYPSNVASSWETPEVQSFFFFSLFLVRVLLYSQAGFKLIILLPRLPECWITGVNYYTWQIFLYFHYVLCLPNTDCLMDMHCG